MAENVETILEFPETLRTKENDFVYLGKTTAEDGSNDTKLDVNGGLHYKEIDIGGGAFTFDLNDEAYNRNFLLFKSTEPNTLTTVLLDNIDLYKGKKIVFSAGNNPVGEAPFTISSQTSTETSSTEIYSLTNRSGAVSFLFDGSGTIDNITIEHNPYKLEATYGYFDDITAEKLEATTSIKTPLLEVTYTESKGVVAEVLARTDDLTASTQQIHEYMPVTDSGSFMTNGTLLKLNKTDSILEEYDPVTDNADFDVPTSSMTEVTALTSNTLHAYYNKQGQMYLEGSMQVTSAITTDNVTLVTYPVTLPTGTSSTIHYPIQTEPNGAFPIAYYLTIVHTESLCTIKIEHCSTPNLPALSYLYGSNVIAQILK